MQPACIHAGLEYERPVAQLALFWTLRVWRWFSLQPRTSEEAHDSGDSQRAGLSTLRSCNTWQDRFNEAV